MMNVSKEGKMRLHNGIIVVFLLSFLLAGFHNRMWHEVFASVVPERKKSEGFLVEERKTEQVYMEMDRLSTNQILKVQDYIKQLKETEKERLRRKEMNWFNFSILPMLKEYAQEQGAVLEIMEEEETNSMTATLSEIKTIDISSQNIRLKTLFMLASYTVVEAVNEKIRLFLTYELQGFEG